MAFTGSLATMITAGIASLEALTGMPIVVVDPTTGDQSIIWEQAARKSCSKTSDKSFCPADFQFMQINADPFGQTHIVESRNGSYVCVVQEPSDSLSAPYAKQRISGSFSAETPSKESFTAFFSLYNAAKCLVAVPDSNVDEDVPAAFAVLMLTLYDGDSSFVDKSDISDYREIANLLTDNASLRTEGRAASRAADLGERILLNHWKTLTADRLEDLGCTASVRNNSDLDIEGRNLPSKLRLDACGTRTSEDLAQQPPIEDRDQYAVVTDENVHLWMKDDYEYDQNVVREHYTVGHLPTPYQPFSAGVDGDLDEAVSYSWNAAAQIASQF